MSDEEQSQSISPRTYQFDPIDADLFWARARLKPGERIQAMLDARELLVGLMRGRLHRLYPDLSLRELNLKVLEEIERVKSIRPRS